MHRKTRLKLTDVNPLLTCSLCKGYLINATTLTECLHSFCKNCIVRYLQISKQCPKCDVLVHKTRPLLNARPDRELQNIVYKMIPGLFKDEMKRRREFYEKHPKPTTSSMPPAMLEDRGEISDESLLIYSDDESMYLSLEYSLPHNTKSTFDGKRKLDPIDIDENGNKMVDKRYLRCPAAVCIKHIKKFIINKFDLKPNFQVEITYEDNDDDPLPEDYTLMDVAYIYTWRKSGPMPLVFRVFEPKAKKKFKADEITVVTNGEEERHQIKKGPQSTTTHHQTENPKNDGNMDGGKKSKHKTNHTCQEGKENQMTDTLLLPPCNQQTLKNIVGKTILQGANDTKTQREREVDSGVDEELSATDDSQNERTLSPTKRNLSVISRNGDTKSHMAVRTSLVPSGV